MSPVGGWLRMLFSRMAGNATISLAQPWLNTRGQHTVELRFNELLYNEVLMLRVIVLLCSVFKQST